MNDFTDFDSFVRQSLPRVLAYAVWYCGNRQNAEDAVQEAFAQAYAVWPQLTHPEKWVRTVVMRRFAKDARKWWWLPRARVDLEIAVPASYGTEDEVNAAEVLRSVGLLPRRQRQVLVMVCLEGRSYQETADELRISIGAVGANLAKARERLRALLGLAETPDRTPGDPFVAAPLSRANRTGAEAADPVLSALLAADEWLVEALRQDTRALRRVESALRSAIDDREAG